MIKRRAALKNGRRRAMQERSVTDQVLDAKSRVPHNADGWRTHIHKEGGREY